MLNSIIFSLMGGVSLLLYGLNLVNEGLRIVGENKLRLLLGWVTGNRLKGLITGIFLSLGAQSSSAISVMLVGFASAGLLTLRRVIPLILGANIGSTFTVQLIAFNVLDYALLIVTIGYVVFFVAKNKKSKALGSTIMGFGFIFLGLKILIDGMQPMRESDILHSMFLYADKVSVWSFVFSAVITALLHSSAAAIGMLIALANSGMITMHGALPIIIGANLGTCASALISSIGENVEAKRVAFAHTFFKLAGVVLILPFMSEFIGLVEMTSDQLYRQIANAHFIFNVAIALCFLPLAGPVSRLILKLMPVTGVGDAGFAPRYLDRHVLESPPLALGQATREILRMGDIVQGMFMDTMMVLKEDDMSLLENIESRDDKVDCLDREIKLYITKITERELSEEMSRTEISLLSISNDLENIGDIIDKNIMEIAKKKIYKALRFSREGLAEIIELHKSVSDNFQLVMNALATQNPALAEIVINEGKQAVNKKESKFRQSHIKRLQANLKESIETSAIHMDVLTNMKRINSHLVAIAYSLL